MPDIVVIESNLRSLLSDIEPQLAEQLVRCVLDEAEPERQDSKGIDYDIRLKDGFALKYSDLLGIEDMVAAVKEAGDDPISPAFSAKLILRLIKIWSRLRKIRVPVSAEQIKILKFLRKKPSSAAELAAYLSVEISSAQTKLKELGDKTYLGSERLVETKDDQLFTTSF